MISLRPAGAISGAQALRIGTRPRGPLYGVSSNPVILGTILLALMGLGWAVIRLLPTSEELTMAPELVEMPTIDPVATSDLDLPLVTAPPSAPELTVAEPPKGLQVLSYTVQSGDTVHELAERYGVSSETIVWANDLADADLLGIGDTLEIPPVTGVLHRVRPGDTVADLVQFY
ncbi:MAG TPA: LysM domain-containing protein, partial [Chloroflexota bacterium]|nr:LysM domain-containing protein [Chloroflexota bacterium]